MEVNPKDRNKGRTKVQERQLIIIIIIEGRIRVEQIQER